MKVWEVYELNLSRVDLVVLGACQTQMGELSAGDELKGLNQVFVYESHTVIASLWSVEDGATGSWMVSFYRHLLERMDP